MIEDWIKRHSGKLLFLFFFLILTMMAYMCISAPKELRGGCYLRLQEISGKIDKYKQELENKEDTFLSQVKIQKEILIDECRNTGRPHTHDGMFGKAIWGERDCYCREEDYSYEKKPYLRQM